MLNAPSHVNKQQLEDVYINLDISGEGKFE